MSVTFARPAFALALAAMLLRALLPAGWMPNNAGPAHALITICTMDGPQRMVLPDAGKPAPDQHTHDRASAPCAFATAAPFAPLCHAPILLAPHAIAHFTGTSRIVAVLAHAPEPAHLPRAPPTLA